MNPQDNSRDEDHLASLLAAANKDAAPPDREFLDRLRTQSTEVFRTASAQQAQRHRRRRSMISGAMRVLAASAAAAILIGVGFYVWVVPHESDLAFGKVLENIANAETLHLQLTRQGQTGEVWTRRPHQLRWDEADGTYRIADGSKLWLVNEKANQAKSQASPFYHDASQTGLDLLDLLDLPAEQDRQSLRHALPTERVERDGHDCHVYRMEVPVPGGKIRIEALVDATTNRLTSLETKAVQNGQEKPLTDVTVLAYNQPVPQEKFVVKDTLTEDGRIGKVTDAQGIVTIKPVMHQRWTPVRNQMLLKPGDWVRTDVRGANAVALHLMKQTRVILGPGTLVELVKPMQIRLLQGQLEIAAPANTSIELFGPDEQKTTVKGAQFFRLDRQQIVQVDKEPLWLKGFKGTTANESIGSLVANVDGRDVPLTVGYHKVSVDIRDQIARTVIEESFVNHTDGLLEGVFYFPLPQDASISGFGMWIGNNLVEADVVEKQRAREIYEIILHEKRDPGLLEWSGGNIFKARVYPIFARSEKRIRITYTQVLPLKGDSYRYSYGLQSELLKQHPLKDLTLDVKVYSALPLKNVTCPTHPARLDKTAHSAHVEFSAQEYTPTRDLEVVIEVASQRPDVVVVPHRRGDDGYFMLQLTPRVPGEAGEREIVPDGEPLQLLILADTSASMDASQRANQEAFIAALLSTLTPKDTVNLAACDVQCDWVFEKPVPAEVKNIQLARQVLADRVSLGWTDLDKAFASALQQAKPGTHVVYVGDGIVTTGDADPVAFAKRLPRLYEGKAGVFHAVATGNSFESGVLKAIASLGSGSVRRITGEQGPRAVALELLQEIAQPALHDLKVEFKGLRPARVYPELLPNIPPGSQQILLGRYLPEGRDQVGGVIVTGTRGTKPVRYSTRIALKDAEQGNSFIPRLWARMHLDKLLEQGTSEATKDEIIALSEEYNIITPYTSFLVLETDEDRERFKVKRRFQMKDGEKFFAQGRDNANFELMQKQMKRAGDWRVGLRRTVLQQLAALGRDPQLFRTPCPVPEGAYSFASLGDGEFSSRFGRLAGSDITKGTSRLHLGVEHYALDSVEFEERLGELPLGETAKRKSEDLTRAGDSDLDDKKEPMSAARDEAPAALDVEGLKDSLEVFAPAGGPVGAEAGKESLPEESSVTRAGGLYARRGRLRPIATGKDVGYFFKKGKFPPQGMAPARQWLEGLFPSLPPAPTKAAETKSTWPAPAQALARSLLRTHSLAKLTGGIEIVRQSESFRVPPGHLLSRSQTRGLFSPKIWLTRVEQDGAQTIVNWCDGRERGILSRTFQLGRLRASASLELQTPPLELLDGSLVPLDQAYPNWEATLKLQGKNQTLLVLRSRSAPSLETQVLVDTARHVVLSIDHHQDGKSTTTYKFDDFIEVAGCWWARRIEVLDQGRLSSRMTQTITPLTAAALDQEVRKELAGREQVQFLREPLPSVDNAKRAQLAGGDLTVEDQVVLLRHFASRQQWTRVMEHLQQCERLATGKPGIRWLRDTVLHMSRRHEELKKRLFAEASRLAKPPAGGETNRDQLFLANHLFSQASDTLQANEMLALLMQLQPVYQRQAPELQHLKHWQQRQVQYLHAAGQPDEARRLQKQLATDYPDDADLQYAYAQSLASAGDYTAAYAWLDRVLGKRANWLPKEESLRSLYIQLLQNQGRYEDLATNLTEWIKHNPERDWVYQNYLTALIRVGQVEKANTLITQWLREGQVAGPVTPPAARLQAAIAHALGQAPNLSTNRVEERWEAPLAEVALFFAKQPDRIHYAAQIMSSWQFRETDACRRIRKTIAGVLAADIDKLTAEQIQHYVDWIWPDDPVVKPEVWKQVAGGLRKRWNAETNVDIKYRLGQSLEQILRGRASAAELLAFLHVQWREGPEAYRTTRAQALFNALLSQPWSAEYEDEALGLLGKLSDATEPAERLRVQVDALHRLTDSMVEARFTARMKAIEHQEKLSRTELKQKKDENLRLAREGFADRLRQEMAKHGKVFARWMNIERLYLDVLVGRNVKHVEAECWEALGSKPQPPTEEPSPEHWLEDVLRERYLVTLANLAVRKGASAELIDRLLKYIDQGIAIDKDDNTWKLLRYQVLIGLDRPKDLEQALRNWIQADVGDQRWRLSLGYLVAEQGRIDEAIKLFEKIEASDELGPLAYRALADWYMATNRREQHDRALIAVYKTLDEWQISQWINAKLRPWQRGDNLRPSEVDKEVFLLFTALFEKSGAPQNHLRQLQQFYQTTHEFRLLTGMADAVIGHTAGQVYPFLQQMQSVLTEVRDEATADAIVEHLKEVRKRATTVVDQRSLDLLEMLVERRSSELKNQPGPHAAAALTAMQRAFKREWLAGEQRLMADLLAGLGAITQQPLAKEQLRQLEVLHREQAPGSYDRLHVAHRFADTLHAYRRVDEAVTILETALKEFEKANGGVLPASAQDALNRLVAYLEGAGQYARGEQLLLSRLPRPLHEQQKHWLTQRLYHLYNNALQGDGKVSLGSGRALYQAMEQKVRDDLGTTDQDHRYHLINILCGVYRTAHGKKVAGVLEDLKAFAFDRLFPVLKQQTNNYEAIVQTVAQTVRELSGPRDSLEFLVNQIEKEPEWFRYANQDGWSRHGWQIAQWRHEAKTIGALEDRLLKLVLRELRRDLETRHQRGHSIYHGHNSYYWAEKETDFVKTAEEVLAQRNQSEASVRYIAEYLFWGVGRRGRAIEVLLTAHKQKPLAESGQARLVELLHIESRFGESIPLLQPLVEARPDNMHYRTQLLRAYFRTGQRDKLLALLKDTDAFFHQKDRWNESTMATLGSICVETQLFTQAITYYKELIPLHQRTQPNRGIGKGTLANYYGSLAQAYAGLHQTAEAVDAASGAIVSWGPTHANRVHAVETLKQVLRQSADLEGYVAWLDKHSAEIKQDNPIVRKALGQIYIEKAQYAPAVTQLKLAAELQPNDAETQQALISAFDKLGDADGAVRQLLQSLQLSRRDIKLYQDLGRRFDTLQQPSDAERAYTSIVEMLPHESESHTLLAEIREQQNRWGEAITHWEQVARIRSLEPTGLLRLAKAQIHERQWEQAIQTLRKLDARSWPPQSGDVRQQVHIWEQQIEKDRKK
jgi:tetratricopeptide (TPR) repeat protein